MQAFAAQLAAKAGSLESPPCNSSSDARLATIQMRTADIRYVRVLGLSCSYKFIKTKTFTAVQMPAGMVLPPNLGTLLRNVERNMSTDRRLFQL